MELLVLYFMVFNPESFLLLEGLPYQTWRAQSALLTAGVKKKGINVFPLGISFKWNESNLNQELNLTHWVHVLR